MNVKKLAVFAVIMLVVVGVLYWTSDTRKDRAVWSTLQDRMAAQSANRVEIAGVLERHKKVLSATETEIFARIVREADFESSNREKHGSTSDGRVTLILADGSKIGMNYYIGGDHVVSPRFALSPLEIDYDSQFYIESQHLANWMTTWLQR